MAGELSLLAALAAGHLIRAHMQHNRSVVGSVAASVAPTPGGTLSVTGPVLAPTEAQTPAASQAAVLAAAAEVSKANGEALEKKKEMMGRAMEQDDKGMTLVPMSVTSSTSSLPPYSQ